MTERRSSLVATCDQWVRARHLDTSVNGSPAALTLAWDEPGDPGAPPLPNSPAPGPCTARGLAVDRLCRVYRLAPRWLDRLAVGSTRAGLDYAALGAPVRILGELHEQLGGGASATPGAHFSGGSEAALVDATGIAIDADDRLFLADQRRREIAVLDLWSRRTLRLVGTATPGAPTRYPLGLAADDRTVFAVVRQPAGLLRLTAGRGPTEIPLPGRSAVPPGAEPSRVAVLPGGAPVVLWHEPDGNGWLTAGNRPPEPVGAASDLGIDDEGAVVVAPCAGRDTQLRRLVPTATGWTRTLPLDAARYDGSGIVATADGRIGYWTVGGFRLAVRGRVRYAREGLCITYRLDSGVARNRWGRIVLDACLPPGTQVRVATVSSDDEYETEVPPAPALPAACEPGGGTTPALPPDELLLDVADVGSPLHLRRTAPTAWWRPSAGDRVDFYEAPVLAPPGRYLWVALRLSGDGRSAPAVRQLRVEHRTHDLSRRLPRVLTEAQSAGPEPSFLDRFLALADGHMHDLDLRSACRDVLVDPASTPVEALDWLASFVGLVLDQRWHETARRRLVAEIVSLYRRRGTLGALSRYLELFLAGARADEYSRPGVAPVLLEHYRLRGAGGPVLGGDAADPNSRLSSRSVLGAGFRVGGEVGTLEEQTLDPDDAESPFASTAHRFSVLIPRPLDAEQEAAVRYILDTERPAHTAYDLCTVEAGMRVGQGLHLSLSTVIGPTGAFDSAIAGQARADQGVLLGGASSGLAVEAARLGSTSRVG